jgi:hypothetical protein
MTTPAMAEWRSTNGGTHGTFVSGISHWKIIATGIEVKCAEDVGEWKIRSGVGVGEAQAEVIQGPHLMLTYTEVKKCTDQAGNPMPDVFAGKVEYQQGTHVMHPIFGNFVSVWIVYYKCQCPVKLPANKSNEELKEASLENSGLNQIIKVDLTGITSEASGKGCEEAGIKSNKEVTMESTETLKEIEAI